MAFDVGVYARTSQPVRWDDLDLTEFERRPLSEDALRCLRYMSDVETHTVCYLRDLLVTPSHADPEVTTFLTMWNVEEYWHGELLDSVLSMHGVETGAEHTARVRQRLGWKDRLAPIQQSLLANVIGEGFVATHMTWGALNEWCAHGAYTAMSSKEDHPLLTEILTRIAKQETRHVAFYASQARPRLARSRKARAVTRFALDKAWAIVGSSIMPDDEVRHMLNYLYAGPEGLAAVRRIDAKVDDTLPGMAGLQLVERQLVKHGVAV
ncbi:MAG: ferritin-like domain-containing protein [Propionibacteriales bacterium]|nr:ferritin-like domain-containing protein [Propionibacteriales bacterium]